MKGQRASKKLILGVTGSFGSGKTTVAGMFKSCGAKLIDADKVSHSLLRPKTQVYKRIVETFGKGILKKDARIKRRELGRIVFSDKNLLEKLNRIIHPETIRIIKKKLNETKDGIIILDASLILETGQRGLVDKLVAVKTTMANQIRRIQKKQTLTKKEILSRIKSQIPLKEKLRLADFVIDNSGTLRETQKQVRKFWRSFASGQK
jgi:dephospho-CoA kinase